MGLVSLVFVAVLVVFGPFFEGEKLVEAKKHAAEFQGPCQPFTADQTVLCSEFQTLVQDHSPKGICRESSASCHTNVTAGPSSRKYREWGNCYCDSLCKEIGDCCVDYDTWHPVPSTKNTEEVKRSCRPVPSTMFPADFGYVMIDSCPSSWRNNETAHACMSTNCSADPAVILPLLDVTTNITFANIYCAMCHGKSRDLHQWSLRIWNSPSVTISVQDISSTESSWEANPLRKELLDRCIVTPPEAITEPETALKKLCRSYANRIIIGRGRRGIHFKNPHCALFSNYPLSQNSNVRCGTSSFPSFPPRLPSMIFVFSDLHNDLLGNPYQPAVRVKSNCEINEVYDPFRERCLSVHLSHTNNNHSNHNHSTNATHKCNGLRFSPHEYRKLTNNSVFIIPHQKLYSNESYVLVNQTLILCANFSRNYTRKSTDLRVGNDGLTSHSQALRIVTYVGFSLSIISLLILLVTYFLFAELRTYPGKEVMHLSCAMIAMQTVYFVSDPDVVPAAVCAVMGALLHYFILVMFLWTSVIARGKLETFSNLNVDLNNPLVIAQRKKSYIYACVFAWGLPLVVVAICVTLQLTNTGNVAYGGEDGCQLSLPARMYAVAIPVSVLLVFNIIALIRTAVAIKQQGNMAAAANQRSLPVIVLKLTVVMGFTWILGVALAFYPTPYLEYPYVIINSCQGVLICISFVFKKHVFNLYKQRFTNAIDPAQEAELGRVFTTVINLARVGWGDMLPQPQHLAEAAIPSGVETIDNNPEQSPQP